MGQIAKVASISIMFDIKEVHIVTQPMGTQNEWHILVSSGDNLLKNTFHNMVMHRSAYMRYVDPVVYSETTLMQP